MVQCLISSAQGQLYVYRRSNTHVEPHRIYLKNVNKTKHLHIRVLQRYIYRLTNTFQCAVTSAQYPHQTSRRYSPNLGLCLSPWNFPIHFGFLDLRESVGHLGRVISSSQGLYLYTNTEKRTHIHIQTLNIHDLSGIRTHDNGFRASEDSACFRPLGYRDRHHKALPFKIYQVYVYFKIWSIINLVYIPVKTIL
jgi:hypothetical protein